MSDSDKRAAAPSGEKEPPMSDRRKPIALTRGKMAAMVAAGVAILSAIAGRAR